MKATLSKRAKAYLIDIIIVIILLSLVGILYHPDTSILNSKMDSISVQYVSGDLSFKEYLKETSSLYKQIDTTNIFLNLINAIMIIGYFVILPYLNNGQTLGKQFMNIAVKNKSNQPLNIFSLFIRNLIINGLFYLISVIIFSLVIPDDYYFIVITIFGIAQIILLLISMIMVLSRKDRKGLHDIIASTWVSTYR